MTVPSSRSVWLIAIGLSLGPAVSNGLARFAYGLMLPAMQQDLSWTYTEAGWINTANAAGYLIGAVLALRFVGTMGPRRLFIGGMVLTTIALLASALTRDFWLLSLWRVVAGIGGAPVFIAGGAMASTLFKSDPSRNALAIAIYFGGGGLGMLLTGLSIPLIIEQAGISAWPTTWLLLAGLSALATLPAVLAAGAISLSSQSSGGASSVPLPMERMLAALLGYFLFSVGYIVYLTFLVAWMRMQGAGAGLIAATWGCAGRSRDDFTASMEGCFGNGGGRESTCTRLLSHWGRYATAAGYPGSDRAAAFCCSVRRVVLHRAHIGHGVQPKEFARGQLGPFYRTVHDDFCSRPDGRSRRCRGDRRRSA